MNSQSLKHRKKKIRITNHEGKKKEEAQLHLSNIIPYDLMLDILSRQPVKSLVRFQCVSQSWQNLVVTDPIFSTMHFKRAKLNTSVKTKLFIKQSRGFLQSLDYQESDKFVPINHPILRHCTKIWGTSNGLLCATCHPNLNPKLYLVNPSTGACRKVPRNPRKVSGPSVYGFGHSSCVNDYVVVKITSSFNDRFSYVDVYSPRTESWRTMPDIPCHIPERVAGKLVNNSLHWLASWADGKAKLLVFDLQSQRFFRWDLFVPDNIIPRRSYIAMGENDGKICLLSSRPTDAVLWVLRKRGEKEFLDKSQFGKPVDQIHYSDFPSSMQKNGLILIQGESDTVWYESKFKTFPGTMLTFTEAIPCMETLVGFDIK